MAIALGESVGVFLDPWQKFCVRHAFAEASVGRWAAFEVWIVVARQNGKGEVLLVIELAALFLFGEELIVHSAHWFPTAKEAFLRIKAVIEGSRDLGRKVKAIRTANGDVGVELFSGQRLRFIARTTSGGRGMTADRLIWDEAQELPLTSVSSLLPTMAARPNPQMVAAATVPDEVNDSETLDSVRARALAGGDPGLAWMAWVRDVHRDEERPVDLDDRELWRAANPAMGYRITEDMVAALRRSMSPEAFGREILSVWPVEGASSLFDMDRWGELSGRESVRPSPVALGLAMSTDRRWSTIALAGRRSDGGVQVQVVQAGKRAGWVPARVGELVEAHSPVAVVGDPGGPEGSLLAEMETEDVGLVGVSARQVAQASARFMDLVDERQVWHSDQQLLTTAVEGAVKRDVGRGWVFDDSPGCDVSPLRAVVHALHGLLSGESKRERSGKVW